MRVGVRSLIIAVIGLLAACGGGNAVPRKLVQCGPVGQPAATLLYPLDGATNVPDGNFTMVMSFDYGLVSLTTADGTPVSMLGHVAVPSPLPSPSATAEPGFTPYALSIPPLQSHTTYTVSSKFPNDVDVPCTPTTVKIGSFTTQ